MQIFTLDDCMFGAVKLTKNAGPDKCGYSGCSICFDARSQFSLNAECGKNVISLSVENILSLHIEDRKKIYLSSG